MIVSMSPDRCAPMQSGGGLLLPMWVWAELGDHDTGAGGRCGVPAQPWKASSPMATGPSGSVISLKDVHS